MARKKKILKDDFTIDNEPQEICCFSDSPVIEGRCVSSFSFDTQDKANLELTLENTHPVSSSQNTSSSLNNVNKSITESNNSDADKVYSDPQSELPDNNNLDTSANRTLTANKKLISDITTKISFGSVPPIAGEAADTRRSYILRHSTVKKIDEIKNAHPEVSVAVSTIVDMAIAHYYECIFYNSKNT